MSERHLLDHLWSGEGGGTQKHFFDRDAHPRASFKYPKMQ